MSAFIKPHKFETVGGSNPWACQRCPYYRHDPRAQHIESPRTTPPRETP